MRNLFHVIMEADGDPLEAFDSGEAEEAPQSDAPVEDAPPQNDAGDDTPPEPAESEMDELAGFDDSAGGEDDLQAGGEEAATDEEQPQEDQKLSEKANSVLNQSLYQDMVKRNQDIEDTIESIQTIIPVMPYEIVKANDIPMNRLKAALAKGQEYVLEKFVDSEYGENLLFFQKLDALYTILLNEINRNLKKVKV